MKIALYIEDGREQIVLTPQSEHETVLLGRLTDPAQVVDIKRGEFYHCQGGWLRHGGGDQSTILVIEPKKEPA